RGQAGANVLNERLQERFNSHPVRVQRGGREYRIGDKVMQIRNNYDKGVFNGEVGRIIDIDVKNGWMGVQFEGVVTYKLNELDELVPAYAISVHRSQGSQYPAVVMPLMTEHYPMLYRNLLYTAITRAERLVVLVGSPKALAIALQNVEERQRHTSLGQRLQQSPFVKD
ncbi:MAG: ATP-binding domain-containing protein, partial [Chloroflexi bacterium]|nr:ATP-binding domain-containing protein [Chloroflexota bacterium]